MILLRWHDTSLSSAEEGERRSLRFALVTLFWQWWRRTTVWIRLISFLTRLMIPAINVRRVHAPRSLHFQAFYSVKVVAAWRVGGWVVHVRCIRWLLAVVSDSEGVGDRERRPFAVPDRMASEHELFYLSMSISFFVGAKWSYGGVRICWLKTRRLRTGSPESSFPTRCVTGCVDCLWNWLSVGTGWWSLRKLYDHADGPEVGRDQTVTLRAAQCVISHWLLRSSANLSGTGGPVLFHTL